METYKLRTTSPSLLIFLLVPIAVLLYFKSDLLLSYKSTNDMLFSGIFIFMSVAAIATVLYKILKDRKRKRVIEALISMEDYRNIVVAGISERSTSGKHPQTYYVYLCEDPETKNIYETEWIFDIEGSDIKTGDQVRLYESHTEKGMYWVDIDHRESGKGLKKLSEEAKEFGEESFKEVEENKKSKIKFTPLTGVIIFGLPLLFFMVSNIVDISHYSNSIPTIGTVTEVTKYDSMCGSKSNHSCTKYSVILYFKNLEKNEYGMTRSTSIFTNSVSGKDQPESLSLYQKGDAVEVLIEKDKIHDSFLFDGVHLRKTLENKIKIGGRILTVLAFITFIFLSVYLYQKFILKTSSK